MESEDGCLEDGEIVDYTPLERPIELMQKGGETCRAAPLQLSSEEEESPSSSDSSDSESERRKSMKKRKMSKHFSKFSKIKPMNKYDIWSVGLQEESLAENLNSFNVVKTDQSRSVESYNYKLKYELDDDHHSMKQQLGRSDDDREFRTNKRRHGERGNVKMRLGRRDFSPEPKGCSRVLFDLSVTSESTEDEVSKDIVEKLSEKKDDLIYRVVTGVGKQKAIELYNETKRIEEDSDGRRGCTEICTIMWKYLMLLDNRGVKEVALYCDNCAGQQKNHAMFVLLSEFIKQARSLKKIGLNFLMVGHSMMTVDSVHGVIERTVAKKTVFAPSEWATIVTNARVNPFPYEVVKMKRNEFRDWREYSKKFKIENERGEKLQISTVQRAYWSKSEVMGKIDIFKNAADKVSTIYLCQQVRRRKGVKRNNYYDLTEAPFAYPQELNLSSQKYKDLINLCNKGAIPERYHAEYFSLPHSETVPDVLNETDEEDLE